MEIALSSLLMEEEIYQCVCGPQLILDKNIFIISQLYLLGMLLVQTSKLFQQILLIIVNIVIAMNNKEVI